MLPYILSELRDLNVNAREEEPIVAARCVAPGYCGDVADLLDELLLHRPAMRQLQLQQQQQQQAARPSFRPGLVRLVDNGPDPRTLRRRQSHPGRPSILQQLKKELGELARPDAGQHGFAVNVDVQDYRPEELSVQVTRDDGFVVVEGSHEERPDEHGLVRRQFTRRYKIPDGVDPDSITSRLTPDGVLQVSAPAKALQAPKDNVRHVPINCSRPPVLPQHAEEPEQAEQAEQKQTEQASNKEENQAPIES